MSWPISSCVRARRRRSAGGRSPPTSRRKRASLAAAECEIVLDHVELLADQRAQAVTQVVLGILSYARWPVEPAQLRLCIIGPTEYTDDLGEPTGTLAREKLPAASVDVREDGVAARILAGTGSVMRS